MEKQFNIALSEQDINVVLAGLNELPIKSGLQVLQKILSQCTEQAKVPSKE